MPTILSLQYLRAFAVLGVMLSHCMADWVPLQAGVDVFFVLSGFIMWTLSARPTTPLRFWWQRVTRILPLYWLATLLMAVHQRASVVPVLQSLLFWPHYGEQGRIWPVVVPGWTINYEMTFYALVGGLLLLPRRLALSALVSLLSLLSIAHGLTDTTMAAPLVFYSDPILLEFLFGIAVAELWRRGWLPGARTAGLLLLSALGSMALPNLQAVPDGWPRLLLWGVPSAIIVLAVVALERHLPHRRLGWLKRLGDASYATYLTHGFIIPVMLRLLVATWLPLRVGLSVVLASAAGLLVHWTLERPATRLLRRLGPVIRRRLAGWPATAMLAR